MRGAISNDRPYRDLTEQCGHKTFQISGFWADYGQTAPYCLFLRLESQPAPFWGKFNLWRIVVAENVSRELGSGQTSFKKWVGVIDAGLTAQS